MFLQLIWTDILLKNYRNFSYFAEAVDFKIKSLAETSGNVSCSALDLTSKVIDLIEKKISLCNAKVIIEQGFEGLNPDAKRILMLKYVDNCSLETIASLLDVSLRTIYRKWQKAKELFAFNLLKKGYNDAKFKSLFAKQLWIYKDYEKAVGKAVEETCSISECEHPLEFNCNLCKSMQVFEDEELISSAI